MLRTEIEVPPAASASTIPGTKWWTRFSAITKSRRMPWPLPERISAVVARVSPNVTVKAASRLKTAFSRVETAA